ncbi:MAG: hypothetical protein AVDCRST_MAG73-2583 [uncultured Thermomicrobiales bacterium]|uniref:Uncharacterized protein n=1 Tax=uncultured Thermomicrobiales bacterium TaxID=1645740 RepID=A0A6J4UHY9_9BACT|nr:MAG: hypothetical protein AVDCRST_MAG73-2583 [uncultured Thermomicrobiales bacterium]
MTDSRPTTTTNHDPIRLGIIGTGLAVEKLHWPALKRLRDRFEVVAFANRSRPNAEKFAALSGTPIDRYVADYQELLGRDDVEAVLISLPIPLNFPVSRDALQAGKHVLCEKPPGKDAAEGRAFVELAAAHPDRVVLIAENAFYRDDLRLARSLIDGGAIGRVHLVAWRNVSQLIPRPGAFSSTPWRHHPGYDGGPHLDAGVHDVARIRLLCGDADRVSGATQDANTTHGGPSDLALTLRFVSGAAGSYTASYPEIPAPDEPNDLRLYGTEGVLSVAWDTTRLFRPDGTTETHRAEMPDYGFTNEFRNFADAVRDGAPVVGTVVQSWRNMQLVLTGLAAAERGETMPIDPWPDALSADAVPLWRPPGASGLFDGLETAVTREVEGAS